jgi:hypothetical protein
MLIYLSISSYLIEASAEVFKPLGPRPGGITNGKKIQGITFAGNHCYPCPLPCSIRKGFFLCQTRANSVMPILISLSKILSGPIEGRIAGKIILDF